MKNTRRNPPNTNSFEPGLFGLPDQSMTAIETLEHTGQIKAALDLAKQIYKRRKDPDIEAVLLRLYRKRIDELRTKGLTHEADALAALVADRFRHTPSATGTSNGSSSMRRSSIVTDLLLRRRTCAADSAERERVDDDLRRHLTDPREILACSEVPPDDPRRQAASEVWRAFEAVTLREVTDEEISLPGISRRSVFAPWKVLIRAIALLYRGERVDCERALAALPADAAPARALGAIRAILNGGARTGASPAERELVRRICGGASGLLRSTVTQLDQALAAAEPRRVLGAIRLVMKQAGAEHYPQIDRLAQHISTRCFLRHIDPVQTKKALGIVCRRDAHFWRLLALSHELLFSGTPSPTMAPFTCCALWEEFRHHAIAEGRFEKDGPADAALLLHMAGLYRGVAPDAFLSVRHGFLAMHVKSHGCLSDYYRDQTPAVLERRTSFEPVPSYTNPGDLYRRVTTLAPVPDVYRQWFEWVRHTEHIADGLPGAQRAEDVAEAWHRAFPDDARPMLMLAQEAERRSAFRKALNYLDRAEASDALDPEVRQTRLRLLLMGARRHCGQHHIARFERDIRDIAASPALNEIDRSFVLATLRVLLAIVSPLSPGEIAAAFKTLADRFGDEDAARALLSSVSVPFRVPRHAAHPFGDTVSNGLHARVIAPSALASLCRVTHILGARITLSDQYWEMCADRYCASTELRPSESDLLVLARAAIDQEALEAAYPLTTLGLQQRGPTTGWFLFLRAQAIDMNDVARTLELNRAAWHIAREHRATDLLHAMENAGASPDPHGGLVSSFISPGAEEPLDIPGLVDRELTLTAYPARRTPVNPFVGADFAHHAPGVYLDDVFDDDEDDDDEWDGGSAGDAGGHEFDDLSFVEPSGPSVDSFSDAELRREFPSLPVKPLREILRVFEDISDHYGPSADINVVLRDNPAIGFRIMSGIIEIAGRSGRTPEAVLDVLLQGSARRGQRHGVSRKRRRGSL